MITALIAAAAAAVAPPATANAATDICLAMIPAPLAAVLQRDHADYALPRLHDAHVDRLLANSIKGGWPCPFIAIGDFDGDDNLDRAIALRHRTEPRVRIVSALNDDGQWRLETHKDWPVTMAVVSIEPLEAGLYEQTKGGREAAKQLDKLKSIQADHAGFLAGSDEGPKQAFFYVNEEWDSLWLEE